MVKNDKINKLKRKKKKKKKEMRSKITHLSLVQLLFSGPELGRMLACQPKKDVISLLISFLIAFNGLTVD